MQIKHERIVKSFERYLLNRKGRSLFQDEHNSMWHSKQNVLLAETTFILESKFFNIIFIINNWSHNKIFVRIRYNFMNRNIY